MVSPPLSITAAATAAMNAHAERAFPNECCGFLIGRDTPHAGREVQHAWAADNVVSPLSTEAFAMAPEAVLHAERRAAVWGLDVVGVYHSHPNHSARPSATDRKYAMPLWSYMIVGCRAGQVKSLQCWRLAHDRGPFIEEMWVNA